MLTSASRFFSPRPGRTSQTLSVSPPFHADSMLLEYMRVLASPNSSGNPFGEFGGSDNGHIVELLQNQQIVVASHQILAAGGAGRRQNQVVIGITADLGRRAGDFDGDGLPPHEVGEQMRVPGREAEFPSQFLLDLSKDVRRGMDLGLAAHGAPHPAALPVRGEDG